MEKLIAVLKEKGAIDYLQKTLNVAYAMAKRDGLSKEDQPPVDDIVKLSLMGMVLSDDKMASIFTDVVVSMGFDKLSADLGMKVDESYEPTEEEAAEYNACGGTEELADGTKVTNVEFGIRPEDGTE